MGTTMRGIEKAARLLSDEPRRTLQELVAC
jgi:hypothetical protein